MLIFVSKCCECPFHLRTISGIKKTRVMTFTWQCKLDNKVKGQGKNKVGVPKTCPLRKENVIVGILKKCN